MSIPFLSPATTSTAATAARTYAPRQPATGFGAPRSAAEIAYSASLPDDFWI